MQANLKRANPMQANLIHTPSNFAIHRTKMLTKHLHFIYLQSCQLFMSVAVNQPGIDYHVVLAQNALQQCLDMVELQAELICILVKQTSRHTSQKLGAGVQVNKKLGKQTRVSLAAALFIFYVCAFHVNQFILGLELIFKLRLIVIRMSKKKQEKWKSIEKHCIPICLFFAQINRNLIVICSRGFWSNTKRSHSILLWQFERHSSNFGLQNRLSLANRILLH